jgi:hypothetical protein
MNPSTRFKLQSNNSMNGMLGQNVRKSSVRRAKRRAKRSKHGLITMNPEVFLRWGRRTIGFLLYKVHICQNIGARSEELGITLLQQRQIKKPRIILLLNALKKLSSIMSNVLVVIRGKRSFINA